MIFFNHISYYVHIWCIISSMCIDTKFCQVMYLSGWYCLHTDWSFAKILYICCRTTICCSANICCGATICCCIDIVLCSVSTSGDCCNNFICWCNLFVTHWGRNNMAAISQTTLSNAFSWMKMLQFRLKFHWSWFLRVQLTIFQHWFR